MSPMRQQDGKVTRAGLVVRTAERQLGRAPVQQPRAQPGNHEAEDHVDPARQAGIAFLVTVSRLLLGIFSRRLLGIAGCTGGLLDLAVWCDTSIGAPNDVLIHADLLVRCLQDGNVFCCEKT